MNDRPGMIYFCATPIGNLEDITLRVLRILQEVDYIAAEDTRHTLKLLNHFQIKKPLISYHEHNKMERGQEIIELADSGKTIAVVSDAGMPGISDPGYELVVSAIEHSIPFTLLPGPSAALMALVLSGLPTDRFVFEGFLPREKKERQQRLEEIKKENRTVILYEAPHRLKETLRDLSHHLGPRKVALTRELTKIHEEVVRMTLSEAVQYYEQNSPRGEYVIVLEGQSKEEAPPIFENLDIPSHLRLYISQGMDKKEAVKRVARERGLSRNEVYMQSIDL